MRVVADLRNRGYDAKLLVPESEDINIEERCRSVNAYYQEHGSGSSTLFSVRTNAFKNGKKWTSQLGLSVISSRGQTRDGRLAYFLFSAARDHLPSVKMRTDLTGRDAKTRRTSSLSETRPLPCCHKVYILASLTSIILPTLSLESIWACRRRDQKSEFHSRSGAGYLPITHSFVNLPYLSLIRQRI